MMRVSFPAVCMALPFILPLIAIAAARALTFTDIAAEHAEWAAALYGWIVFDSLLLAVIAKAEHRKPELFQVAAALASASVIVILGAASPVRAIYFSVPQIVLAGAMTLALFIGWTGLRIIRTWREHGSLTLALESVLPSLLVRLLIAELRVLALGLFRWGVPADVPRDARGFTYHTYLSPMIATLLALQVIELAVMHFLLMLWSPVAAYILLAASIWGIVWTVALLKSLRINPVLVTHDTVRIRSGMLYDFEVPLAAVRADHTSFTAAELDDRSILNLALLSSPNVAVRFDPPASLPRLVGQPREIRGVGLRLDDSAGFLDLIAKRS